MTGLTATLGREYKLLAQNRVSLALGALPPTVFLVLFATSIVGIVGDIAYQGAHIGYEGFVIPAIMAMSMLAGAAATATSLFQEQTTGMALELASYPLTRTSYVAGKLLATTTLVLAQGLLLMTIAWALFQPDWRAEQLVAVLLAAVCSSLALSGVYLWASTLFRQMQSFMIAVNLATPILLFASPSFYPIDQMPFVLRALAAVNPTSYAIRAMRDALLFGFASDPTSVAVLIALAGVTLALTSRALARRFIDL